MTTTTATSTAAKIAIGPSARNIRARVFLYLVSKGAAGAIDEEVEFALGVKGSTARTRRKELEKRGFVVNSGRSKPTSTGRESVIWVVPAALRAKVETRLMEAA